MTRSARRRGRGARQGVNRRTFLKGLGSGAIGAGLLSGGATPPAPPATRGAVATLGPGPVTLSLKINGRARSVRVEPRVTLLDALRDRLDPPLTGAKKICDSGDCGGCTVLLDGKPAYACMLLAVDARGRAITTIEGIGSSKRLHPVQEAFVLKDALQCGFCTPGFIVASKALLDSEPRPSLEQVRQALCGHICRCGAYPKIFEAVLAAAGRPARAGRLGPGSDIRTDS